jgi:2-polyprenyl-3-methyl-5-hydroxy-6-metoxy-1,4-benzoquinol methylase
VGDERSVRKGSIDMVDERVRRGTLALERGVLARLDVLEGDFRGSALNDLVAERVRRGSKVLDVGCGAGGLSAVLIERCCDVSSRDASDEMVDLFRRYLERRRLPTDGVSRCEIAHLPDDAAYDYVVALDVIEHVEDDAAALRHLRDSLRDGGRLIMSVPSIPALFGPKDVRIGHFRRYRRAELVRLVSSSGFLVHSVRYWNLAGVVPVWFSVHILRSSIPEGFRHSGRTWPQRVMNAVLRSWFRMVENRMLPPCGMTLIIEATRAPTPDGLDGRGLAEGDRC